MNDIEEQIVLAGEVGLMASLGPDGGWVQYCDNAPGDPEDWKGDPGPGWYVCVQADARGGFWIGPFRTREDADTAQTSFERVMNCDADEDGFLVPMSDEAIARWEATPMVGLHAAATLPLDTLPQRVEEQTRIVERTEEEIGDWSDSFDISLRDERDSASWVDWMHRQIEYSVREERKRDRKAGSLRNGDIWFAKRMVRWTGNWFLAKEER